MLNDWTSFTKTPNALPYRQVRTRGAWSKVHLRVCSEEVEPGSDEHTDVSLKCVQFLPNPTANINACTVAALALAPRGLG